MAQLSGTVGHNACQESCIAASRYQRGMATHSNWAPMRACATEFRPNATAHRLQTTEFANATEMVQSKADAATTLKNDQLVDKVHFTTTSKKVDKISPTVGHNHSHSEVDKLLAHAASNNWECRDIYNFPKEADVIRLATANVSTLDPKEFKACLNQDNEAVLTGRISFLEDAFIEAGIDIVGVQESRIQGDLNIRGQHYDIRMAGAESTGRS